MSERKKQIVREFVDALLGEMVEYAKVRYNIPKFKVKLSLSFHSRHTTSYGGHVDNEPVVHIAAYPLLWMVGRKVGRKLLEYDEFKDDPEIGEFRADSWKQWMAAILAHEISHAIQYYAICHPGKCKEMLEPWLHTDAEEHGPFWQSIYRGFRVRFVNNFEYE